MHLRDMEIFLVLAEELHFGRTADRLYVSQPAVSQAIGQLERRLGGLLFDRSNRRQIRLTPLGLQLRDDLLPVYAGLRDSLERARLATQGIRAVLRVGLIPSFAYDLRHVWDAFRTQNPEWALRLGHNPFVDPFAALRGGAIDILVVWLPVEEPDLTVGPLICVEHRALMVSADHDLVGRGPATFEVLGDYGVLGPSVPVPDYWEDVASPFNTPKGRPILRNARIANWDELVAMVAEGQAIQPVHWSAARYHSRPDIAYLPVRDARPTRWGLVWRTETENEIIRALARIVSDLGPLRLGCD